MKLEFIPAAGNVKRIREIWRSLEEGANTSYFLSWGWIGNWLASLPDPAKPELAVLMEDHEPLLAFFLGKANLVRKQVFTSRGWFVNATGIPIYDRTCIEYNGFLCKQPEAYRFGDIVKSLPDAWDEFYLPGLDTRAFPGISSLDDVHPFRTIVDDDLASPYVDLDMVRERGGNYLSLLSSNARSQISRSFRLCEKHAPVRTEVARDARSAIDIYNELVFLHEDTWSKRGKEGAFSSGYMFEFHRQLIQSRFSYDEIQLIRITCENHTIGCLYNFVYKNRVYFYQSGINYGLDKRIKPGLVVHVEAVRHNAAAGHKIYDFLAGGSRYKMSLATHHHRLIWVRLQKPRIKFKIETALKTLKHLLAGLRRTPVLSPRRGGSASG